MDPDDHDPGDHDAVTRRSFERQVGLFTGDDAPFARRADTVTGWVEPLAADMVVLDVACGAGHVAEQLAPHVRQVVGVDLTRALLDAGAARLRDAGVDNVLLQEGSVTRLPFVDASFDLVVCRTALHHFQEPDGAVAEMRRVCRPTGRVVVADMVAPGPEVRDRFDAVHRDLDPSHVRVLLDDELIALMQEQVGPVARAEPVPALRLPLDLIVTDAGDGDAVRAAVRAELDGGTATGFEPTFDGDQIQVAFHITVVEARPA